MTLPITLASAGVTGRVISTQYYDRNSISKSSTSVSDGIGPHSATSRWAYTAPTGRRLQVTSTTVAAIRKTVATTPGTVTSIIGLGVSTPVSQYIMIASFQGNSIDSGSQSNMGASNTLASGESIQGVDADGGVGGTVFYVLSFTGNEFDA